MAKATGNGWTVSTVLGHMAFFDRMLLLRWDTYEKDGVFAELTPNHFDLINDAGAGDWSALPPRATVAKCIEAAERAVARIDALPEEAVAVALETNRVALLERMLHWNPHRSLSPTSRRVCVHAAARMPSLGLTFFTPITSRYKTIEISAIADGMVMKP